MSIHSTLLNSGPTQAPLEVECPVCRRPLSKNEYKKALQELRKTLLHNYQQKLREEKQEHQNKISELKTLQKKQVRLVITQERNRRRGLQEKLNEKTRSERKELRRELREVKRKYQVQLEQLRTLHADQNARLQGELREEYNNNLSELMKRYEEFANNSTQQLEMIHSSIGQLEKYLNGPQVLRTSSEDDAVQQQSITGDRIEDAEEKRLEIERLKKIQEISEMIKKIAQQQHET